MKIIIYYNNIFILFSIFILKFNFIFTILRRFLFNYNNQYGLDLGISRGLELVIKLLRQNNHFKENFVVFPNFSTRK